MCLDAVVALCELQGMRPFLLAAARCTLISYDRRSRNRGVLMVS